MRYVIEGPGFRHVVNVDEDDTQTVIVRREDGFVKWDLVGIDLRDEAVIVGHWPDREEWVEVLDVDPEDPESAE